MNKLIDMHLLFKCTSLLVILIFSACNMSSTSESEWKVVYRNDSIGNKITGDKDKLIALVRGGYPVRIGFGGRRPKDTLKSVEHVMDAQFLTVANGKEVFAQISPIYGQAPDLNSGTLQIKLKSENEWTLLIGTNGERSTLSRYFIHKEEVKSRQSNRGVTWYAKYPNNFIKEKSKPLWD